MLYHSVPIFQPNKSDLYNDVGMHSNVTQCLLVHMSLHAHRNHTVTALLPGDVRSALYIFFLNRNP